MFICRCILFDITRNGWRDEAMAAFAAFAATSFGPPGRRPRGHARAALSKKSGTGASRLVGLWLQARSEVVRGAMHRYLAWRCHATGTAGIGQRARGTGNVDGVLLRPDGHAFRCFARDARTSGSERRQSDSAGESGASNVLHVSHAPASALVRQIPDQYAAPGNLKRSITSCSAVA